MPIKVPRTRAMTSCLAAGRSPSIPRFASAILRHIIGVLDQPSDALRSRLSRPPRATSDRAGNLVARGLTETADVSSGAAVVDDSSDGPDGSAESHFSRDALVRMIRVTARRSRLDDFQSRPRQHVCPSGRSSASIASMSGSGSSIVVASIGR